MRVLVLGSGGREHALAWKLKQSKNLDALFVAPGNGGTAQIAENLSGVNPEDAQAVLAAVKDHGIDLVVVGPEAPLVVGVADVLLDAGVNVVGAVRNAAMLEGSKAFAKEVMQAAGIPTAEFEVAKSLDQAKAAALRFGLPVVVKADGLAAGKGVSVCHTREELENALNRIFVERAFGEAGNSVVIEQFLEGEEASFIALVDGEKVLPFASSQDHKPVFDGDKGPNTGGMGAYSPAPVVTDAVEAKINERILTPLTKELARRNVHFKGVLYCGLMIKDDEPYVLEFNVRFGDPETQPLMVRLRSDLLEVFESFCNGRLDAVSLEWDDRYAVCVVMTSGGYPGKYEKGLPIEGVDLAAQMQDVVVFHAGTKLGDDGKLYTSGGRVLGITALGETLGQAIDRAYAAVSVINWKGVHYRKDIGFKGLRRLRGEVP